MGEILFLLIATVLSVLIWIEKGSKKLPWFFAGVLLFPQTIILLEKPYMPFPRLIIFVLFLTMIFQESNLWKKYRTFPLHNTINFIFGLLLLIGLVDNRLNFFLKLYRPVYYFAENFLILYLTYHYIRKIEDVAFIYKKILFIFILFSLYGVINYVGGESQYTRFISETYKLIDFGNRYTDIGDARFRISSFAWHPIYYGYLLSVAITLTLFVLYSMKIVTRIRVIYGILLVLLVVNLIWTNSRTPLLAMIAGVMVFFVFGLELKRKLRLALSGLLLVVLVSSLFPSAITLLDESINTFTAKGSKLEGSSVEMRDMQTLASLKLFVENPYFGHGYGYIFEDLGYSTDSEKKTSSKDFAGFESFAYKLLIEQGLAGIIGFVAFLFSLIRFLIKSRRKGKSNIRKLTFFSIGMVVSFFLFIFGTGDLGAFTFFMALLGINIKAIVLINNGVPQKIINSTDLQLGSVPI